MTNVFSKIFCLSVIFCLGTVAPKVLLASADNTKIAQVKAGTLHEANASWWGFDKNDSTIALQTAINSGVRKLIIDNKGSDWIINKPLTLVSDQEIVFAKNTIVQAKQGAFKGVAESLFIGRNVENLIMTGQAGAKLRMRRADYANPALYSKAEWRSGISLYDSSKVRLNGLTIEDTGGDGLYLGASEDGANIDIVVENCVFNRNYRNAISVISAENLTIRNCKLINTEGTDPQYGIDFEPNKPGQRIVDCVVENTLIAGNKKGGATISTANLRETSMPVSIDFKNCTFRDNDAGFSAWIVRSTKDKPAPGRVNLENCTFEQNTVFFNDPIKNGIVYSLKDCLIRGGSPVISPLVPHRAAIMFTTDHRVKNPVLGGINFENVTLKIAENHWPVGLNIWSDVTLSDAITGTIQVEQGSKKYDISFPTYLQQNQEKIEVSANARTREIKANLQQFSTAQTAEFARQINMLEKAGQLKDNLAKNGDFSLSSANEQLERRLATNWPTWQAYDSAGSFDVDETINHSGTPGGSAKLMGVDRGVFQQDFAAKPGETFVIRGWMRRKGQGIGALKAGWKTTDKKWIDASRGPTFYVVDDEREGVWQRIEGIVAAPANTAFMVITCGVMHQRNANDQMWFDDIEVYNVTDAIK